MKSESYINHSAADVHSKCNSAIRNMQAKIDSDWQKLLEREISNSKKGVRGWWRRLWKIKDLDLEKAKAYIDPLDEVFIRCKFDRHLNVLRILRDMAAEKSNGIISVSRSDYNLFNSWGDR